MQADVWLKLAVEEKAFSRCDTEQNDVDPTSFVLPLDDVEGIDADALELVAGRCGVADKGNLVKLHGHGEAVGRFG